MEFDIPALVIDAGSTSVKAGLTVDESPSIVIPSLYSRSSTTEGDYHFGDSIDQYPENEVLTTHENGIVYNWDAVAAQWEYIYSELAQDPKELPLVVTENSWASKKPKSKVYEVAFENLEVPVFSLLRSQLCTSYSIGRPTSLVIELGGATTSVTPIHNGKVLSKGVHHTKFAGDFLNLFALESLRAKSARGQDADFENSLLPRKFQNRTTPISDSFKAYQVNKTLTEMKASILAISPYPITADQFTMPNSLHTIEIPHRDFELPTGELLPNFGIGQFKLSEPLFQPAPYAGAFTQAKVVPESLGLTDLVLTSLKKLEANGEVYQELLKSVILTGGSTYVPGLEQRLINDLVRFLPNFSINTYCNPDLLDRNFSAWHGAVILGTRPQPDFENLYISKHDYEEIGEDGLLERSK
ncbi:unnamed protein product [Kuraishia capsulata CBS 1993]|uniref:Actin-related protein 4 n=1 Tax=Kuraishia capsulata CBS 1993 TaxID=1382522 RepID=W6MPL6_9ASCO|nr:uncharacterized protein KUCA_T00003054001 [Kuraishia capsulata CBS 1993]CDK27077.1 unnamed protein product [Kuraishia capsulata CBS 1993]